MFIYIVFLQPSLNPEGGRQNNQNKPLGTPSGVWGRWRSLYTMLMMEQKVVTGV